MAGIQQSAGPYAIAHTSKARVGGLRVVSVIRTFERQQVWSVDINDVARVQRGFLFFDEASAKEQV